MQVIRLAWGGCMICALLGCPSDLRAQQPDSLTIDRAVELALAGNSELQAALHEVDAAAARELRAGSWTPPGAFVEFEDVRGLRLNEAGSTKLGIEQEFAVPGKRRPMRKLARLDTRTLEAEALALRRRLTAEVKDLYYFARFQDERIVSLAVSEGLLAEFLETTRSRFEAGDAPYLDVVRAKLELSRLHNEQIAARREAEKAKASLNLLLGRSEDAITILVTRLIVPSDPPDRTTSVLRVEEQSARLEAARLRVLAAEAAREVAGKTRVPDVNVATFLQRVRSEEGASQSWGGSVSLSLPVPWWREPRSAVREADANRSREDVRAAATLRGVRSAAEQAYRDVAATLEQVRQFESSILDDLDSELQAGIDAYQASQIDALNLIDIYRTYVESRTEYSRSLYLHLSALARLEAAGDLDD